MPSRLLRHTASFNGPLKQNVKHQFAVSYAMAIHTRNTVFTFIPKNACTLMRYNVALENHVISGPEDLNWIHRNNSTFTPSHNELVTAAYTFVILRCPFRRLVSHFLHRIIEEPHLMLGIPERNPAPTQYLAQWFRRAMTGRRDVETPGNQPETDSLTFSDFVAFLEAPGVLGSDIHWRPQADFLVYREYDDFFRLEDMPGVMTTVQEKAGFAIRGSELLMGHGNRNRDRIQDGFFGRTDVSSLWRLKQDMKVPDYERFYDSDLYARVGRLYAEDIALYAERFGQEAMLRPV